jgi:hypothetical protein
MLVAAVAISDPGQRRLLRREEVVVYLQLSDEQVQVLINTRQLTPIRIAGEERFDLKDLEALIRSYKATSTRRADEQNTKR